VTTALAPSELDLSLVVTHLMKGVVYQDTHPLVWRHLLPQQAQVRDYVATMGLTLQIDEAEGYAFLRAINDEDSTIPRLVPRHSLSFPVSLLLALLRRRLAEFDATDSGSRCVLSREQIADLMRVFLADSTNEARILERIDQHIGKAVDLGFLRRVKDHETNYEIRRILKAFVDAQWLAGLDEGLRDYATAAGALRANEEEAP
jgi:hypothetical protein